MSKSPASSPASKKPIKINATYYLVGKKITATLINPLGDGENHQYDANKPPLRSRESLEGDWIETDQGVNLRVNSNAPIPLDIGEKTCYIFIECKQKPSPPIGNFPLPNPYFSVISDFLGGGYHEYTKGVISIVSFEHGKFQGGFELQKDSDGKGIDITNGRFDLVYTA